MSSHSPSLPTSFQSGMIQGRLLTWTLEEALQKGTPSVRLSIHNLSGITTVDLNTQSIQKSLGEQTHIALGSIVSVDQKSHQIHILTPNLRRADVERGIASKWTRHVLDPERLHALQIRRKVENGIRAYFDQRDFLETRTPLLVPCPGMETHIRSYRTHDGASLPTSPEFAMKRLLVGGLERIYQLSTAFRDEPKSSTHHPEFQMLEFYRAYSSYEIIMDDVENLFTHLARTVLGCAPGEESLTFGDKAIRLSSPWERHRVPDLFKEIAGVSLFPEPSIDDLRSHCQRLGISFRGEDLWDDLYFLIWMNAVEPRLPCDRPVIVYHYPPSQAALSVVEMLPDSSRWARRFEVYVGGMELGNAFEELTDPTEQRKRFVHDMEIREQMYGPSFPKTPLDEGFLEALEEGMPPSSGIAMGVDRMVMLYANQPDLRKTLWLESFQGKLDGENEK